MLKLNAHARIEIALMATLLLGSCGDGTKSHFTMDQRDEIRDLAREATSDDMTAAQTRLSAVEEKLGMPDGGE